MPAHWTWCVNMHLVGLAKLLQGHLALDFFENPETKNARGRIRTRDLLRVSKGGQVPDETCGRRTPGTRKAKHRVEEKRRAAWDSLAVGS